MVSEKKLMTELLTTKKSENFTPNLHQNEKRELA